MPKTIELTGQWQALVYWPKPGFTGPNNWHNTMSTQFPHASRGQWKGPVHWPDRKLTGQWHRASGNFADCLGVAFDNIFGKIMVILPGIKRIIYRAYWFHNNTNNILPVSSDNVLSNWDKCHLSNDLSNVFNWKNVLVLWSPWSLYTLQRHLFNSWWPSDVIWWQRSGSILAQVMACFYYTKCIEVPSSSINKNSTFSQVMAWRRTGYKASSGSM